MTDDIFFSIAFADLSYA